MVKPSVWVVVRGFAERRAATRQVALNPAKDRVGQCRTRNDRLNSSKLQLDKTGIRSRPKMVWC